MSHLYFKPDFPHSSLSLLFLTSPRTHHQYLMDHPLHGAHVLLPHVAAVGASQRSDAPLPVTFQVGPFLHDLTNLKGNLKKLIKRFYCVVKIHLSYCSVI